MGAISRNWKTFARLQVGWAQISTRIESFLTVGQHKRKMTLLEAPTGALLFYCKNIKQGIVHTLLFEKYGVSKKWVIIMDMRQDSNATSTSAGIDGPSAQDRYGARSLGGGAKKRRENGENLIQD